MSKPNEERDIYYIPPNFLASGRLFGGMIRARNAIEACVLVLLTGIPIIKLPMSLTVRIIILCLLPLPLGIFGIIGFEGDSLSEAEKEDMGARSYQAARTVRHSDQAASQETRTPCKSRKAAQQK